MVYFWGAARIKEHPALTSRNTKNSKRCAFGWLEPKHYHTQVRCTTFHSRDSFSLEMWQVVLTIKSLYRIEITYSNGSDFLYFIGKSVMLHDVRRWIVTSWLMDLWSGKIQYSRKIQMFAALTLAWADRWSSWKIKRELCSYGTGIREGKRKEVGAVSWTRAPLKSNWNIAKS